MYDLKTNLVKVAQPLPNLGTEGVLFRGAALQALEPVDAVKET